MVSFEFILYHVYSLITFLFTYGCLHLIVQMVGRVSRAECSSGCVRQAEVPGQGATVRGRQGAQVISGGLNLPESI